MVAFSFVPNGTTIDSIGVVGAGSAERMSAWDQYHHLFRFRTGNGKLYKAYFETFVHPVSNLKPSVAICNQSINSAV